MSSRRMNFRTHKNIVDDLKNKIITVVNNNYNALTTAATTYASETIKATTDFSGTVADVINSNIPYVNKNIDVSDLYQIIDNAYLTRKEYDELEDFIKQQKKIIADKISDDYRKATDLVENKFKDALFRRSYVYYMRINDAKKSEIFKQIYQSAYDENHSAGYESIEAAFESKDTIIHSVASIIAPI